MRKTLFTLICLCLIFSLISCDFLNGVVQNNIDERKEESKPDNGKYVTDTYTREGNYIYFGEYPNTLKANDVLITDSQDERGYYLGSDGCYYAKVVVTPFESGYTFSDGSPVDTDSVYYFKVEPIRWRILTEDGEKAFLLCDSILANVAYQSSKFYDAEFDTICTDANGAPNGTCANNYKYSEVRKWLNDTFYNVAFPELQKAVILTTLVNNSAESAGDISNPYVCENTEDKVFLLSHAEATKREYGFASSIETQDKARFMQVNDFARATGAYMHMAPYTGRGMWLLRSPASGSPIGCRAMDGGRAEVGRTGGDCAFNGVGIVPAIWIRL